jgi:hypothetical protein
MQEFVVEARDRKIQFVGEVIGSATTHAPSKERWAEVQIFRTEGGSYVVAGVGRSTISGETDRRWAHSSGTPDGVIEALYLYDDDDVRYLPHVNKRALQQAAKNDRPISEAFEEFTEYVA